MTVLLLLEMLAQIHLTSTSSPLQPVAIQHSIETLAILPHYDPNASVNFDAATDFMSLCYFYRSSLFSRLYGCLKLILNESDDFFHMSVLLIENLNVFN